MKIHLSKPVNLAKHVTVSDIYQNYTASGKVSSYGVDLIFKKLSLRKIIKSKELHLLGGKVEETLRSWSQKFERHLDQTHKAKRSKSVDKKNRDAREELERLEGILSHTIDIDDTVDWDSIKRRDKFRTSRNALFATGKVPSFIRFDDSGRPTRREPVSAPKEPTLKDTRASFWLLTRLFGKKKIASAHASALDEWRAKTERAKAREKKRDQALERASARYQELKEEFEQEMQADNQAVDEQRARYARSDVSAIEDYCDIVLTNSVYPDCFPKTWELEYRDQSRMIVVNYDLPSPNALPHVESYRYVKARDEIASKELSSAVQKKLYNSVIHQTCLRTIHELFEADAAGAIDVLAFNGLVNSVNPATGASGSKVIMSVSASREPFEELNLSKVDPKAAFKHLKGVSAANLIDLAPIPPVIVLNKGDKRFIEGRDISANVDSSVNLAAMHWEDFEHLIRELFEQEFADAGGEVRVTQGSADGGVDAVAFDPDPIRGGKVVIQAKRYTNTVGVSAVRDLYGTVMNEGATKGILVTTTDYGKDSYEFAKDKPLTLLNGSNLLSLLEKHGTQARINIAEAKKILDT